MHRPVTNQRVPRRLSDDELLGIYDQQYVDQYDPHAARRLRRMLPYIRLGADDVVADFGCGNGMPVNEALVNAGRERRRSIMSPWIAKTLILAASVVMIVIRAPHGRRSRGVKVARSCKGRAKSPC